MLGTAKAFLGLARSFMYIYILGCSNIAAVRAAASSTVVLSRALLQSWNGKVPDDYAVFWMEIITITLSCIVGQRNRLSPDNICIQDPAAARGHCAAILKKLVFELRKLVRNMFAILRQREKNIANSAQQSKYVLDILAFQKSYLGNSIVGTLGRGDSAGTYSLELATLRFFHFPPSFNLKYRFFLENTWANRLRGRTAARASPSGGPDSLPPEGIT